MEAAGIVPFAPGSEREQRHVQSRCPSQTRAQPDRFPAATADDRDCFCRVQQLTVFPLVVQSRLTQLIVARYLDEPRR